MALAASTLGAYPFVAIKDTGEWWFMDGSNNVWTFGGMIVGTASVPDPGVAPSTWGQIKSKASR